MIRICFICYGNICRSPMAEFIFKDMVKERGMEERFFITSMATSDEEEGNDLYYAAQEKLDEEGIPWEHRHARQLSRRDYGRFDYLIVMEPRNRRDTERIMGGDPEGKIRLLLSFAGEDGSIADPWYTRDFDTAYRQIVQGCRGLLSELSEE